MNIKELKYILSFIKDDKMDIEIHTSKDIIRPNDIDVSHDNKSLILKQSLGINEIHIDHISKVIANKIKK